METAKYSLIKTVELRYQVILPVIINSEVVFMVKQKSNLKLKDEKY